MATSMNKANSGSGGGRKRSPGAMLKAIRTAEPDVHEAALAALRNAGLNGVTIHAIHFSVDPEAMTGPFCPGCDLSVNTCVLTPGGPACIPMS